MELDREKRRLPSPPSPLEDLEPDTDDEFDYSTPATDISRITTPIPSLTPDHSIALSHRSMPDSPASEDFSPILSSPDSVTPSPVKIYEFHDRYHFQDDVQEFLVSYV